MRIVSGSARRLKIETPEGETTRPTSDRVREAVFNSLHSFGLVEERTCADLFAGSGALGLEALSRGAAHCHFVEKDRRALRAIETNVENLDFAALSTVRGGDGLATARTWASGGDGPEVVFLDPPYEFDGWEALLADLHAAGVTAVVIESDRTIEPGPQWHVLKEKRYGGTVVVIAESAGSPADGPTGEGDTQ